MATTRYCLECGYSRQGLPQDALCPECGKADLFEKQREACASLVDRPLSLLWRVMTLRRLPKGWWVVFDDEHPPRSNPWQYVVSGVLIVLAFGALSLFVRIESTTTTYWYDINDPQHSVIAEQSVRTDRHHLTTIGSFYRIQILSPSAQLVGPNLRTGYARSTRFAFGLDRRGPGPELKFVSYLLAYSIVVWLLSRFVWLPLIARDRRASAFRRAARLTAVIYVAHLLWLITASVLAFLATLIVSLVSTVNFLRIEVPSVGLLLVVLIISPVVIWWQAISADTLRQEFPKRIWAGVLLTGLTLVALMVVYIGPRVW